MKDRNGVELKEGDRVRIVRGSVRGIVDGIVSIIPTDSFFFAAPNNSARTRIAAHDVVKVVEPPMDRRGVEIEEGDTVFWAPFDCIYPVSKEIISMLSSGKNSAFLVLK